jgi:hypothetical protein
MSGSLRSRLRELAAGFAGSVLDTLRGASLEELFGIEPGIRSGSVSSPARRVATTPRPRGDRRLSRRSSGDVAALVERLVGVLEQHPGGLRAEEIREKLGLQAKELPRPLKEGLDSGRFSKSGQKRATTYFLKAGSPRAAGLGAPPGGRARAVAAPPKPVHSVKRGPPSEVPSEVLEAAPAVPQVLPADG